MFRNTPSVKGAGCWMLCGLLVFCGGVSFAADGKSKPAPLTDQLAGLGRQAQRAGRLHDAARFYRQALKLDPKNAEARTALGDPRIRQVAMLQDPEKAADPKEGEAPA